MLPRKIESGNMNENEFDTPSAEEALDDEIQRWQSAGIHDMVKMYEELLNGKEQK